MLKFRETVPEKREVMGNWLEHKGFKHHSWRKLKNQKTSPNMYMGNIIPPRAFLMSQRVKNLPANAGDVGDAASIPGLGRSPGGGHGNPLQYSCLENPHRQRSLAGYSPWCGRVGHD